MTRLRREGAVTDEPVSHLSYSKRWEIPAAVQVPVATGGWPGRRL